MHLTGELRAPRRGARHSLDDATGHHDARQILGMILAGLAWCVGRLPVLLRVPAKIRQLERSGFSALTSDSGGDMKIHGEVEELRGEPLPAEA